MDTQAKYGLKKSKAILLFVQMILLVLGTVISGFVFVYIILKNQGGLMFASTLTMFIAHISILLYGAFGHKKGQLYYLVSLCLFAFAIVVNIMVGFRTPFQHGLLAVLFGTLIAYIVKQNDKKQSLYFILVAFLLALTFSITAAVTANPHALGDENISAFTVFAMYASIFGPTVICGTFVLLHSIHTDKEKLNTPEEEENKSNIN